MDSPALTIRLHRSPVVAKDDRVPAPPPVTNKPITVKRGALVFRIYPVERTMPTARGPRTYKSHILSYSLNRKRVQVARAKLSDAMSEIDAAETKIANGQTDLLDFSSAKRARWNDIERRCKEKGLTPEEAVALGLDAHEKNNRTKIVAKPCPEVVELLKGRSKSGPKWNRIVFKMYDRIAERFTGPLTAYSPADYEAWLDGLDVSKRTRLNYRTAIGTIVRFARKKFVPADFDPLAEVSNPEPAAVVVNRYEPDELEWLLHFAEGNKTGRKLVAFISITAFAYIRHGEMNEEKDAALDVKNIRFKTKRIFVPEDVAKKTRRAKGDARVVDMPDNLVAWLKLYLPKAGRICPLKNTSNALCRLRKQAAKAAQVEADRCANVEQAEKLRRIAKRLLGPKRNALRKSCISYRKALTGDIERVADGAGNSPGVIKRNYLDVDEEMKETAERWFAIMPKGNGSMPLFEWGSI